MKQVTNYAGKSVEITIDNARDDLLTDFGKATIKDRYTLKGESSQDMFARVAGYYSDDSDMAQRVYDAISKHWFMPSTPILSNGGTTRGNPISCFLNSVADSMEGIEGAWSENVWLASKGGGIGTNWSGVRSIAEKIGLVESVGETSGIIPFIKVQDSLTLAIAQGSLRRGSSAVYLDINHPEIEEFIDIRKPVGDPNRRCLNIHHGVNITDEFMEAVKHGRNFNLISPKDGSVRKTVKARELWQKILLARLEQGEPYIVFIDTVNRNVPEMYKKLGLKVSQSNLCSEIALHTGIDHLGNDRTAVCCLSSINAAKYDEWNGNIQFVRDCLVFLDNVLSDFINKTEHMKGFEKARYSAMRERAVGLGIMGFHSLLQDKGIPFESAMAHAYNLRIHKWLKIVGDEVNTVTALERGACPDAIDAGLTQRWSHMFSIAPTASISIICGGASPCEEPWAANVFTQKTLSGSFSVRNQALAKVIEGHFSQYEDIGNAEHVLSEDAWKSISDNDGSVQHLDWMTDDQKAVFKTSMEIDQRWVVSHAAARAPYIDQMASNNLFILSNTSKADLHGLHMKAWKDGVPSLYYCRSKSLQRGSKIGHVAGEMPHDTQRAVLTPEPTDYEECLPCQ